MSRLEDLPSSFALLGGIPIKSQDFVISIVLAIVYSVLGLVALLRVLDRSSRCKTLLRPVVFVNIRAATFGIRALQADGHYSEALLIVDQILLLCGFILLCEPLVDLLGHHITRYQTPAAGRTGTGSILHLLKLALYVALGLGIWAGTQFDKVGKSTSALNTVKTLRDINAGICASVTVLVALAVVAYHLKESLPAFQSVYLFVIAVILTVPSLYKLYLYTHTPVADPLQASTKHAFYLLNVLPELIAGILLLAINLKASFDIDGAQRKGREPLKRMPTDAPYPFANPYQYSTSRGGIRGGAVSTTEVNVMAAHHQPRLPVPADDSESPLLAPPHAKLESSDQGTYTGYHQTYGHV